MGFSIDLSDIFVSFLICKFFPLKRIIQSHRPRGNNISYPSFGIMLGDGVKGSRETRILYTMNYLQEWEK